MLPISKEDLETLRNYEFTESHNYELDRYNCRNNPKILGLNIKNHHLVQVERKDINIKNLFLRLFNHGKLAFISLSLEDICVHLKQYNWADLQKELKYSDAFKKTCQIASRYFVYHRTYLFGWNEEALSLFKDVSKTAETNHGDFYFNNYTTSREIVAQRAVQLDQRQRPYHFLVYYLTTAVVRIRIGDQNFQTLINPVPANAEFSNPAWLNDLDFQEKTHPDVCSRQFLIQNSN